MVVRSGDASPKSEIVNLWDLNGPPDAEPFSLRNSDGLRQPFRFDPRGRWLVTANARFGILWPLSGKFSRVLRGATRSFTRRKDLVTSK
jgi:hypothetical protein